MSTRPATVNTRATRLIIVGASGRMGARLCQIAHDEDRFTLVGALTRAGSERAARPAATDSAKGPAPKITDSAAVFGPSCADVVIDFSSSAGTLAAVELARRVNASLLVGTTALDTPARDLLRAESRSRAVLLAPNTSLGVAALADLVRRAAAMLKDFDCSLVESHHIKKKDAPSGTALRLAEAARKGGANLPNDQVLAVRGGDVIGEHTLRFAGPGEYLELSHRATSRDVFVRGALRAAAWLHGREPGWWTMEDVLGLEAR
jgi:4-hydroxy-tetrahydrodipicolinate reductase